jgi:hypothetical protein
MTTRQPLCKEITDNGGKEAGMELTEAERAVIDHLSAEPVPRTRAGPPRTSGWAAYVGASGGAGAVLASCEEFTEFA